MTFDIIPTDDPEQALRIRRFLLASAVYAAAVALMGVYVWLDYLRVRGFLVSAAVIIGINFVFFALLRSGRNRNFKDPSMTGPQMLAVAVTLTITMYFLDSDRGALLLLFVALLMFGAFRLHRSGFLLIGVLACAGYALAVWSAYRLRPVVPDLRTEGLNLIALGVLVIWGGLFVEYVAQLRRDLRRGNVELQRTLKACHDLESLDELTGLSNRRSILRQLEHERERAVRLGTPLAVALVDLDDFKRVNATHDNEGGDQVLREVSTALNGLMRPVDCLGRYAAEEFLVIMPDTGLDEALAAGRKFRDRIDQLRFPGIDSRLHITASVGVSTLHDRENSERIIHRTTRGTSDALAGGGNSVVSVSAEAGITTSSGV